MTNAANTKNTIATARKVKDFNAARLDWNEARHFCKGSRNRTRKNAKRQAARALRRTARAAIADFVA